jgi:hypothetical protein
MILFPYWLLQEKDLEKYIQQDQSDNVTLQKIEKIHPAG